MALSPETSTSWERVPAESVGGLVSRRIVEGRNCTLLRYVYQPGAVFPVHRHPEEQITLVLEGRLEFTVREAATVVGPGEFLRLGPDTPHGARVVGDRPVVSLNFFSPARSEHPHVR
jgi:quercetin dioxygenase-like cupin family protein